MTRAEIVQLVRDSLGFNNSLSEDIILRHMDAVQALYEGGTSEIPLPWFLLDTTVEVHVTPDTRTVEVPARFIKLDEDYQARILIPDTDPDVYIPLKKMKEDEAFASFFTESDTSQEEDIVVLQGRPQAYSLTNGVISWWPLPEDSTQVVFPCYRRSELKFSEDADASDWYTEFPNLIAAETTLRICKANRDQVGMQIASADVGLLKKGYLLRVEEEKHVQMDYVVGDNS